MVSRFSFAIPKPPTPSPLIVRKDVVSWKEEGRWVWAWAYSYRYSDSHLGGAVQGLGSRSNMGREWACSGVREGGFGAWEGSGAGGSGRAAESGWVGGWVGWEIK